MNRTPHRRHTEYAMRTFLNENEFPCEQVPIEVDLELNGAHFVYVKWTFRFAKGKLPFDSLIAAEIYVWNEHLIIKCSEH